MNYAVTAASSACARRKHHDKRSDPHSIVEIDGVLVGHTDAARRDGMADIFRLIGAVNPVQRVRVAFIKVQRPCPHRIVRSWADVSWNIAKPTPDFLGWHPGWPFLHPPDFGDPRPGERSLPHRDSVPKGLHGGEAVPHCVALSRP